MRLYCILLTVSLIFTFESNLFSANRYWVSAGAGNWNNTANWSATSNGTGGASVPVAGDVACFDAAQVGDCTIDVPVSVDGFSIAGYTGTISQGANSVTIGTSHFTMSSGTYNAGSGILLISGDWNNNGGTFTCGTSAVTFSGTANNITGTQGTTFYDVVFAIG